ncbi:MAG: hypothetical protein D3923_18465 [Candidatus Electrothrix sp. AR3]|nr:hypothetical protein [Candidatus Electrothrix sp. AR3]
MGIFLFLRSFFVPNVAFKYLFSALRQSKEILESNIGNEEGPKKKKNAQIALDALLFSLEEYIYQDIAEAA